mmetsp:Transcript_111657/g.301222  ORF Transcript_111657/g.301222 Transcript_111657/m.301222 type:complete len:574 (-) Transcript_111657:306-2027(-)
MPCQSGSLVRCFKSLDLRFKISEQEAKFKRHLDKQVSGSVMVCIMFIGGVYLVTFLQKYLAQISREDLPFTWHSSDPRTLIFSTDLFVLVTCGALFGVLCVSRMDGRYSCISAENLGIAGVSMYLLASGVGTRWCAAYIYGERSDAIWASEELDSEFNFVLQSMIVMAISCSYVPIRSCVSWIYLAFALLTYLGMLTVVGSAFPRSAIYRFALLCFMFFTMWSGSHRQEWNTSEKWLAQELCVDQQSQLRARERVTQAMQQVGGLLSDVVLELSAELRITNTDQRHRGVFGRDIEGYSILDFMHDRDKGRFQQAVEVTSRDNIMQSVPTTLSSALGEVPAHLTIVTTRCDHPRYLVSVQTGDAMAHTEVRSENTTAHTSFEGLPWPMSGPEHSRQLALSSGVEISCQFDALDKDFKIMKQTAGWLEHLCGGVRCDSLTEVLQGDLLQDFRSFVRQNVSPVLQGTPHSGTSRKVYGEVEGMAPDGKTAYTAVMVLTLLDPASAFDETEGSYRVELSWTVLPSQKPSPPLRLGRSQSEAGKTLPSISEEPEENALQQTRGSAATSTSLGPHARSL